MEEDKYRCGWALQTGGRRQSHADCTDVSPSGHANEQIIIRASTGRSAASAQGGARRMSWNGQPCTGTVALTKNNGDNQTRIRKPRRTGDH